VRKYIIDASVAVKWLYEEPFYMEARRFLQPQIVRIAPDLIILECLSAIQRKVKRREITPETGWQGFSLFLKSNPIQQEFSSDLMERAYELSNVLWHSVYDCIYLALAEKEDAILVTADRKMYERVKTSAYSKSIAWVEEPPVEG